MLITILPVNLFNLLWLQMFFSIPVNRLTMNVVRLTSYYIINSQMSTLVILNSTPGRLLTVFSIMGNQNTRQSLKKSSIFKQLPVTLELINTLYLFPSHYLEKIFLLSLPAYRLLLQTLDLKAMFFWVEWLEVMSSLFLNSNINQASNQWWRKWQKSCKWGESEGGGAWESEPPTSHTLLSRLPYLYLPTPILVHLAQRSSVNKGTQNKSWSSSGAILRHFLCL